MQKIAVINDLSGFGKCSLTAAIPVISVQGIQACPLPTAILSNQTGYPEFFCKDFTEFMDDYINCWKSYGESFDAVLTGFIANEKQADIAKSFCEYCKQKNSDTLVMVDPAMADDGEIYATYSKEMCDGIKELAYQADIITPNLTEFAVLTESDYSEFTQLKYSEAITELIQKKSKNLLEKGIKTIIVTSVPRFTGKVTNVIIDAESTRCISSDIFEGSYSGTGDLFASSVCAGIVNGKTVDKAVESTVKFLEKSIRATAQEKTEPIAGICFEPFLNILNKE